MAFPSKAVRGAPAPTPERTRRPLLFEAGGFRCGLDVEIFRGVAEHPGTPPAREGHLPLLGSLPVQGDVLQTVDLGALFEGPGAGRKALVVGADWLLASAERITMAA